MNNIDRLKLIINISYCKNILNKIYNDDNINIDKNKLLYKIKKIEQIKLKEIIKNSDNKNIDINSNLKYFFTKISKKSPSSKRSEGGGWIAIIL